MRGRLALAPVAVQIDANLGRLRKIAAEDVERELQFELNSVPNVDDRAERARRVLALALRHVDLHGWDAAVTEDGRSSRTVPCRGARAAGRVLLLPNLCAARGSNRA